MDVRTASAASNPDLDRTGLIGSQDEGVLWTLGGPKRGRLRVRTLITLRWMGVAGQAFTLLFVWLVMLGLFVAT